MKTAKHTQIPETPEERLEWIKFQLRLKGMTLRSLADQYGVSRYTPAKALHVRYPLWEARIAEALGRTAQELWPERYQENGLPKRQIGFGKPKKHRAAA